MLKRKYMFIGFLALCLAATLFIGVRAYDPWVDLNDDGVIDSTDDGIFGVHWGSIGTPINKTGLLLDLQEALEARIPQTGYVSVSAAAFRPCEDGYDYLNLGRMLENVDSASDYYYAPVQLPHGATVTRLTFYWSDTSGADGYTILRRSDLAGSYIQMAAVYTTGSGGVGSSVDADIFYATINNSMYSYYLLWSLPDIDVKGYGVVIEYEFSA